jgi:hypothetical protein
MAMKVRSDVTQGRGIGIGLAMDRSWWGPDLDSSDLI